MRIDSKSLKVITFGIEFHISGYFQFQFKKNVCNSVILKAIVLFRNRCYNQLYSNVCAILYLSWFTLIFYTCFDKIMEGQSEICLDLSCTQSSKSLIWRLPEIENDNVSAM